MFLLLVFECRPIIVFAERIILSVQLSWLLCFSGWLGKVLLDDFSSLQGERDSDLFLCSGLKEGEKYHFLGLLCLSAPTVEEAAVIAQDGRFIDWDHV